MSQQRGLAATKANCILGCESTASRPRDVTIPPSLAFVRPHLEHHVQLWPIQLKKTIEKLEGDQQKATKSYQKAGEQGKGESAMFIQPEQKASQGGSSWSLPKPKPQLERCWKCFPHVGAQWWDDKVKEGKVLFRCEEKIFHHENNKFF